MTKDERRKKKEEREGKPTTPPRLILYPTEIRGGCHWPDREAATAAEPRILSVGLASISRVCYINIQFSIYPAQGIYRLESSQQGSALADSLRWRALGLCHWVLLYSSYYGVVRDYE
jgi:hypothetical protein